jgi:hypothetical protein
MPVPVVLMPVVPSGVSMPAVSISMIL